MPGRAVNPLLRLPRPRHDEQMSVDVERPTPVEIPTVLDLLASWQSDAEPFQLHPGDHGWEQRHGIDQLAAGMRLWRSGTQVVAIGMGDADVLRMTMSPPAAQDARLVRDVAATLATVALGERAGRRTVEVPNDVPLRTELLNDGWTLGERWSPLRRLLDGPVEQPALRVEVVAADQAQLRAAQQVAAFPNSTFTAHKWALMAEGHAYRAARCLIGYDGDDVPVAAVTVWAAGEGRPGLLEPLGVHREHRRKGYGRDISLAAADQLRRMGASSATVCTPSANTGGVATYESAGYEPLAQRQELVSPPRG